MCAHVSVGYVSACACVAYVSVCVSVGVCVCVQLNIACQSGQERSLQSCQPSACMYKCVCECACVRMCECMCMSVCEDRTRENETHPAPLAGRSVEKPQILQHRSPLTPHASQIHASQRHTHTTHIHAHTQTNTNTHTHTCAGIPTEHPQLIFAVRRKTQTLTRCV